MPNTYRAKHKRILRDGQISRGPARWARAAAHAMQRPTDSHGRQFWDRAERANWLRRMYQEPGPFAHPRTAYRWAERAYVTTVGYYTCSTFCMGMVAQLDNVLIQTPVQLLELVTGEESENAPYPARPTRDVRCYFCGWTVRPR